MGSRTFANTLPFQDLQGQIHGRHSRRQQAQGRKAASRDPSIGQRQRFQRPQGCRPIKGKIDLGQEEIIDDWSSFFLFLICFFLIPSHSSLLSFLFIHALRAVCNYMLPSTHISGIALHRIALEGLLLLLFFFNSCLFG